MTENKNGASEDQENTSDPAKDEEAFWAKHKEHTVGILDEWFEKKKDELRKAGTSRTGSGRTTLPGILANFMYGPEKKD